MSRTFPHGRLPLPVFGGVQPFLFSVPRGGGWGFPELFSHGRLPLPVFGGVQPFLFSVPRGGSRGFSECFPMAGCRSRFSGVCSLFCFLSREGEVGVLSPIRPLNKKIRTISQSESVRICFFYFFVSLPRRRGRRATGRDKPLCPPIPPSKRPCPKGCQTALGTRQPAVERVSQRRPANRV